MFTRKLIFAVMFVLLALTATAHAAGDPTRGNDVRGECSGCHGEDGMGDEESPRVAGHDESYIFKAKKLIKRGERSEKSGNDAVVFRGSR